MLPFSRVPLGEWLPDRPAYPAQGATLAKNCVPQATSYRALLDFVKFTDPASGGVVGATWAITSAGTVRIIVGTPTQLLLLNGLGWTVLGTGYPSVPSWEFAQFGDSLVAVAPGVDPQVIDLSVGAPAAVALVGAPDSPPRARRAAVVRDFVMLGDLDAAPDTIQWSGYNNSTIWATYGNTAYQADSQKLFTGGVVQRIVGGPFGYVFQESEIRAVEYVGPPVVFSISVISRDRGTPAGDSVIAAGDRVFFYAQDGFHMLQGKQFTAIGEERVNRWFLENVAADEIVNMRGSVDRVNRVATWAFSSTSGGPLDKLLIYNYAANRWSYADTALAFLVELRTPGYDLDTLSTILTAGIDADSFPIESRMYLGGALSLVGANAAGQLGTFTGDALDAVLETPEFDGGGNVRRLLSGIRPIVEGSSSTIITAQIGHRNSLLEPVTWTGERSLNSTGEANILLDARYVRVRLNVRGGFTHASAVDVLSRSSGRF
jgi:hypothetical protein